MTIAEQIRDKAVEYLQDDEQLKGETPPMLIADFVIEQYKIHRNYPPHFSAERIEDDLTSHLSTLAMAVVDVFSHYGAEGETEHREKNITRIYENAYLSKSLFGTIPPYVRSL